MLNGEAAEVLTYVTVELWTLADRWKDRPEEAEALAAAGALRRVAEAVRDAIRLRPVENKISDLTRINLDAIASGLEKTSATAAAPELAGALVHLATRLRNPASSAGEKSSA